MTTDTTHAEACRLLRQAADLLDEVGLHQGDYWPGATQPEEWSASLPYKPGQPCCGLGVIRVVSNGGMWCRLTAAAASATRWVDSSQWPGDMATWNDTPGRTTAEVSTHLRAVADAHEGDADA